jgi:TPR repeat protein
MTNAAKTQRATRRARPRTVAIFALAIGVCLLLAAGVGGGNRATAQSLETAAPGAAPMRPAAPAPPGGLSVETEYGYGEAYDAGSGVPQDFAAAVYWYRSAALRGYPPAQLALARYCARGVAVPKDFVQGYVWANRAAAQMPPGSLEHRAAEDLRDYFRFKLTAAQMTLAQQSATGWPPLPPHP